MKKILIILLHLFATKGIAQKIALFDVNFKRPIIYTDSVTVQQTTTGLFPVGVENFDTLYANLDYIHSMLQVRQRAKMKSFELHAGSTTISIKRVPFAYGDRYLIIGKSKLGEVESNFNFASIDRSNAKNAVRIKQFMTYMKTNKDLFKAPNDIHPKMYNVIVITE
jgi:hypothetical protein